MFFIHLADPGFEEPPWPGQRRLGPFLTVEEAQAQAANDIANGQVSKETFVGIFSDKDSESIRDGVKEDEKPPPEAVPAEAVHAAADEIVKTVLTERVRVQDESDAALATLLKDSGVTVDDLREAGMIS